MNTPFLQPISTPIGSLLACATPQGICLLAFEGQTHLDQALAEIARSGRAKRTPQADPFFDLLERELKAYFEGKLTQFTVPLDLIGTPFQCEAWKALLGIAYGKTLTYSEQAQRLNRPQAIRAIAHANATNKVSLLVPCHRVIAKNGSLAGYAGGLWRKRFLLELEQHQKTEGT